jgi:YD repeat-containing protein
VSVDERRALRCCDLFHGSPCKRSTRRPSSPTLSHTTTYTYDDFDRVATRTDPLSNAAAYDYDFNGGGSFCVLI